MKRLLAALVVAASAVLTAGCGALPAPDTTSTPDTSGVPAALLPYYGQRIVWKDCGDGLRCATAAAPLDWAAPGGDRIRLALVKRPATGTSTGTLFTNPGGPGASGVDFVRSDPRVVDPTVLEHHDLVGWDPRGIGDSAPVRCYGTEALDGFLFADPDLPEGSAAQRAEVEGAATAFGRACLDRTGPLLAHIGTADTVRDLDMLRAALGSAKLDYFGFSYGTAIGARYADRYPTRVGRMVLDGALDPRLDGFAVDLAQTRAFGAALGAYLRDCLRSSSCPFRGGTVEQAYDRIADLLLDLRRSPLRAADGREVNSTVMQYAIDYPLYDRSSWRYLTDAFTAIFKGDPAIAQRIADAYAERGPKGYTGNLLEAFSAVNCLDAPTPTDREALERQGRALNAANPLRAADDTESLGDPVCASWPVPAQGRPGRVHATGAPPILVLGTTGDPATPIQWGRGLVRQLPGGVLLTLRGEGHTAYRNRNRCINDRVDAFLTRGTVPRTTTCG